MQLGGGRGYFGDRSCDAGPNPICNAGDGGGGGGGLGGEGGEGAVGSCGVGGVGRGELDLRELTNLGSGFAGPGFTRHSGITTSGWYRSEWSNLLEL